MPARVDLADQPVEVLERAEFRRHVLVAAAVRTVLMPVADGVRHAGFARLAGHGVVAAFARGDADRMDRREIDHVEAHRLRVIDARQAIAKGRAAVATPLGGARKEFIPCREARARAIHDDPRIRRYEWDYCGSRFRPFDQRGAFPPLRCRSLWFRDLLSCSRASHDSAR